MATMVLRTNDLAKELSVHVNTIRLYEASGFLSPVPRGTNGYRQYRAIHLEQARLAHLVLRWPYVGNKQRLIDLVKSSANGDLGMAMEIAYQYLAHVCDLVMRRYSLMKMNHLNLTVTDVTAAAQFLETYFGLRNQGGNKGFTVLFDDNGLVLSLMKARDVTYPGTFHIGFIQESEQRVNEMYQQLKDDGFEVEPPQRHHGWTFYVQAPGGFTVEVLG
jgi:lactoylglutathione lyase